jgi:hypothetical protein
LESERISGGLHALTGTMLIPSFKNNISLNKVIMYTQTNTHNNNITPKEAKN